MFNRFLSNTNINKKLAEELISKAKPVIEKKLESYLKSNDPMDIAMRTGRVTGAAISAASAYDEKASATKNIIKGTAFGILGGGIGYVAPPITSVATIAIVEKIVENAKPLMAVSGSIGLGLGTATMFSKLTPKSPSENLENINVNDTSNKKSHR